MDDSIYKKLTSITEEEKEILSGHGVNRSLYSYGEDFKIGKMILMGRAIGVRNHTRFIDFPLHSHEYTEVMYVYKGKITHVIENKKIELTEGNIIIMNKNISHAVLKCGNDDIGFNFFLSDSFIKDVLISLKKNSLIKSFMERNIIDQSASEYIVYQVKEIFPIRNLLDNLIYSIALGNELDMEVVPSLMGLLIEYLSIHKEAVKYNNTIESKSDGERREIISYIETNTSNASLNYLAKKKGITEEYLSRKIKLLFGKNFSELLLEERMKKAESLLVSTSMPIYEIIESIGYENKSYFHHKFLKRHKCTPSKWRKENRVNTL